jgi:hypothetical protein
MPRTQRAQRTQARSTTRKATRRKAKATAHAEAPERNPQVTRMVRRALDRKPDQANTVLYERAKALDPAIGDLSMAQFNARYVLPRRNVIARSEGRGRRSRGSFTVRTFAPQAEGGVEAARTETASARLATGTNGRTPTRKEVADALFDTARVAGKMSMTFGEVVGYMERRLDRLFPAEQS